MKLLLVRHGNTFAPGDKTVWVGARTDLPLVSEGKAQAQRVAEAVVSAWPKVDRIYAGPLLRTQETAAVIGAAVGAEIQTVEELREIDYGRWEGRSNEEIKAEFGDEDVDAWQKLSVWPEGYGWTPSEEEILAGWKALVGRAQVDFPEGRVVVVSSNGIFRLVAKMYGMDAAQAKMNTGHMALVELENDGFKVLCWNVHPADFQG